MKRESYEFSNFNKFYEFPEFCEFCELQMIANVAQVVSNTNLQTFNFKTFADYELEHVAIDNYPKITLAHGQSTPGNCQGH